MQNRFFLPRRSAIALTDTERVIAAGSLVGALGAVIVGYTFPSTGAHILKDFVLFTSAAGLAFVFARASYRSYETKRVQSLCSRTAQRLGLVVTYLRDVTERLQHEVKPSDRELICAMVNQHAKEVEVTIGDLEEMAGTTIRFDQLVAAARKSMLETVKQVLQDPKIESEVAQAIQEPLNTLAEQVKDAGVSTVILPTDTPSGK